MMRFAGAVMAAGMLGVLCSCGKTQQFSFDQSTPQTAARSLMTAIDDRDPAAVVRLMEDNTEGQRQFVAAMTRLLEASGRLTAAATQRFDRESAKQLLSLGGPQPKDYRPFEDAPARVTGDTTVLTAADQTTLELRQDGPGVWKIVPGAEAALAAPTRAMSAAADVFDAIATKMRDDPQAYDSIEAAQMEISRRLPAIFDASAGG